MHYRRYFQFLNIIPDLDKIFEYYDVILPHPYYCGLNLKKHYHLTHNINDLITVGSIIKDHFNEYDNDFNAY